MEQDMQTTVAALEAKVLKLEKMLVTIMTGPFKTQKETLDAMRPMFVEWESGTGKFEKPVPPVKRKRKPLNWVDYNAVMSEADVAGEISYRDISKRLDIPDATVRRYVKLSPAEVSALQQDHLANEAVSEGGE